MSSVAMPVTRRRFTADEYERMGQAGILGEDDPVELLEGEVVEIAPIGSAHAGCVNRLNRLFGSRLGNRAVLSVQNPIRLGSHSEPQPDVALLRPRDDFYEGAHPTAGDVLLIVEVSSSSAAVDRLVKLPLYARAAIPQAWIVDVDGQVVEVYRTASRGAYPNPDLAARNDRVVIDAYPDVVLTASDILGAG